MTDTSVQPVDRDEILCAYARAEDADFFIERAELGDDMTKTRWRVRR